MKLSREEVERIAGNFTFSKTIRCDPEYVVIRWYKKLKGLICGKKSK